MEQISIRCMQLPLIGKQLLVPNSAVAEVISYSAPQEEDLGQDWLDGRILWRGVMIPVISIEKMCQSEYQAPGPRSRIAVIYNLEKDPELPYVGIILQDIPRAYIADAERMQEVIDEQSCPYLKCKADMMLDQLVIPDLDTILQAVKHRLKQGH